MNLTINQIIDKIASDTGLSPLFNQDSLKYKEIVVWMRIQKNMDKDQLKEFIISKFNVSDFDSEKLFNTAFPVGLDFKEKKLISDIKRLTLYFKDLTSDIIYNICNDIIKDVDMQITVASYDAQDNSSFCIMYLLLKELLSIKNFIK
jgi:hypothetical protein